MRGSPDSLDIDNALQTLCYMRLTGEPKAFGNQKRLTLHKTDLTGEVASSREATFSFSLLKEAAFVKVTPSMGCVKQKAQHMGLATEIPPIRSGIRAGSEKAELRLLYIFQNGNAKRRADLLPDKRYHQCNSSSKNTMVSEYCLHLWNQ